jgi:phosphocarrier protein
MATEFVSPEGRVGYPRLNKPDTRYNPEGLYTITLSVEKSEAKTLVETIRQSVDHKWGIFALWQTHWPYADKERSIEFRFKSAKKPAIFDAEGAPVGEEPNIGPGSIVRVSGTIGLRAVLGRRFASLQMNGIQILNLAEPKGPALVEIDEDEPCDEEEEALAATAAATVKRVSRELVVGNKLGGHSRAAAKFVQTAQSFESEIIVERENMKVDGKSIMGFLLLTLAQGARFTVHAVGKDADQAVEALRRLVEEKFGEW